MKLIFVPVYFFFSTNSQENSSESITSSSRGESGRSRQNGDNSKRSSESSNGRKEEGTLVSEKKVQVTLKTLAAVTAGNEIIFCTKALTLLYIGILFLQEKCLACLRLKKPDLLRYSKLVFLDAASCGAEAHKGHRQKCFIL